MLLRSCRTTSGAPPSCQLCRRKWKQHPHVIAINGSSVLHSSCHAHAGSIALSPSAAATAGDEWRPTCGNGSDWQAYW
eukprot:1264510-Rhodomonas_salina.1